MPVVLSAHVHELSAGCSVSGDSGHVSPEVLVAPVQTTSGQLAAMLGGTLRGPADLVVNALSTLEAAGPSDLTFIRAAAYAKLWETCQAKVVLVAKGLAAALPDDGRAIIEVAEADLAMVKALELFHPELLAPPQPFGLRHPSAIIEPGCTIDPTASIGAMCYIGPNVTIGPETILMPRVTVLAGTVIGASCLIQSGVVLGGEGFGYRPDIKPGGRVTLVRLPHAGNVAIGDHVDIGANTCVDRARFGSTSIGDGTKIDNLVQIAHNCRIGRACIICGQTGLSGSVTLGDGVQLGGAAGVRDNVTIGSGVKVAAMSGIITDVPANQTWAGLPAMPGRDYFRVLAAMRKLAGITGSTAGGG